MQSCFSWMIGDDAFINKESAPIALDVMSEVIGFVGDRHPNIEKLNGAHPIVGIDENELLLNDGGELCTTYYGMPWARYPGSATWDMFDIERQIGYKFWYRIHGGMMYMHDAALGNIDLIVAGAPQWSYEDAFEQPIMITDGRETIFRDHLDNVITVIKTSADERGASVRYDVFMHSPSRGRDWEFLGENQPAHNEPPYVINNVLVFGDYAIW